jgi:hypothetical protein
LWVIRLNELLTPAAAGSSIKVAAYPINATASGIVGVPVTGLTPLTAYSVYCVT